MGATVLDDSAPATGAGVAAGRCGLSLEEKKLSMVKLFFSIF